MGVSNNMGKPPNHPFYIIGFGTIICTIHFGGKKNLFLETPQISRF